MNIKELLQSAEYVVAVNGKRKATVVDLARWEEILTLLEDLDAEEIRQMRDAREEYVTCEQAKAELRSAGKSA